MEKAAGHPARPASSPPLAREVPPLPCGVHAKTLAAWQGTSTLWGPEAAGTEVSFKGPPREEETPFPGRCWHSRTIAGGPHA